MTGDLPAVGCGESAIVVRTMRVADTSAVASLWRECTAEVAVHEPIYSPTNDIEALAKEWTDRLVDGSRFGWVAESNGALAGYVTCELREEAAQFVPRRFVYVHDLDVAPGFRRLGVSRALIEAVEVDARARGVHRLELSVVFADPRSRKVWERHGFAPHLLVLHRDLTPDP